MTACARWILSNKNGKNSCFPGRWLRYSVTDHKFCSRRYETMNCYRPATISECLKICMHRISTNSSARENFKQWSDFLVVRKLANVHDTFLRSILMVSFHLNLGVFATSTWSISDWRLTRSNVSGFFFNIFPPVSLDRYSSSLNHCPMQQEHGIYSH